MISNFSMVHSCNVRRNSLAMPVETEYLVA